MNAPLRRFWIATPVAIAGALCAQQPLTRVGHITHGGHRLAGVSLCFKEDGSAIAFFPDFRETNDLQVWSFPAGTVVRSTLPLREPSDGIPPKELQFGCGFRVLPTFITSWGFHWPASMPNPEKHQTWPVDLGWKLFNSINGHAYLSNASVDETLSRDGRVEARFQQVHISPLRNKDGTQSPPIAQPSPALAVYRDQSRTPIWTHEVTEPYTGFWLSPDGSLLLLARNVHVQSVETSNGTPLASSSTVYLDEEHQPVWFATGSQFLLSRYPSDGNLIFDIVDARTLKTLRTVSVPQTVLNDKGVKLDAVRHCFQVSPDGKYLVTAYAPWLWGYIQEFVIWSLEEKMQIAKPNLETAPQDGH